jgi:CBS domain-containing protein
VTLAGSPAATQSEVIRMRARDIMSKQVVSVRADATIAEAVAILLQQRISAVPVLDPEDRLVGILSEGDLLRRSELGTEKKRARWLQILLSPGRLAEEYARAHGRRVEEVMTREVVTVDEDAPAVDIVDTMSRHRIKRVPVLHAGRMIGIVSRADLIRALGAATRAPALHPHRSDDEVRRDIEAEFARAPGIPAAQIHVTVQSGVVDLTGAITDERERNAVHAAVGCVPGVARLRDHLIWIEPISGEVLFVPDEAGEPAPQPAAARSNPSETRRCLR